MNVVCAASILNAHTASEKTTTIAPMLQKIMPSVVAISGYRRVKVPAANTTDNEFRPLEEQITTTISSGVIVDVKRGYVVTNAHVVQELEEIKVLLADNRKFVAKLLGQDVASDLALLEIPADNLTSVPFADSDKLQVGDFVVAIGNPYGMIQTVTSGIVSALGRTDVGFDGYYDFIQTDAAVNLGNSGGGLFDLQGRLIGINTALISPASTTVPGNVGLGLAIPINMARGILEQLARSGHVDRGPLGVRAQPLTPELAQGFQINYKSGAIVIEVAANTTAARAGLQEGDILVTMNGKSIKDNTHLRTLISLVPIGQSVKIEFVRNGKLMARNMIITNPLDYLTAGETVFSGLTGAVLEDYKQPDLAGVIIADIKRNTSAAQTELQENDIIIAANNQPITNINELKAVVSRNKKALLLKIVRKQSVFFVAVLNNGK